MRDLLCGKARDDLPRTAGLDAALREALEGKATARGTVELAKLFDRLVQYRNREFGHGAAGQKPAAHYDKLGRALLAGLPALWDRLDVLAGHRLVYVAEVRRRGDGAWIVERHDFSRERERALESLIVPGDQAGRLPLAERLYLEAPPPRTATTWPACCGCTRCWPTTPRPTRCCSSTPGAARHGSNTSRYTSGRVLERADLAGEQRELLRAGAGRAGRAGGRGGVGGPVGGGRPTRAEAARPRRTRRRASSASSSC